MDQKYEFDQLSDRPIVYVREVRADDLPAELRVHLEGRKSLYTVHDAAGQRLALVPSREMAFILARQNDLSPVNVH